MSTTPKAHSKRSRSSEGETPRPENKQSKMADNVVVSGDLKTQLSVLIESVKEIKEGQDGLKRMVESKIDKLRSDVLSTIDEKIRALKSDIDLDIGISTRRIDDLVSSVQTLTVRIDQVERVIESAQDTRSINGHDALSAAGGFMNWSRGGAALNTDPLNDNTRTVIVKNVPYADGENLMNKARDILVALGEEVSSNVNVTAVARLKPRFRNKPGLVKIGFETLDQKILVLRNKSALKDQQRFRNIFIQSSKSHVERLLELNARTLLRELPTGRTYRVSANGRILKKRENERENEPPEMEAQNSQDTD